MAKISFVNLTIVQCVIWITLLFNLLNATEFDSDEHYEILEPELYSKYLGPLLEGEVITVNGRAYKDAERFNIDFISSSGDIILQVSPTFTDKAIDRNSFINKTWGTEERKGKVAFNMRPGHVFSIGILVGSNAFSIFIDGMYHCDFTNRVPISKMNKLEVSGGAHVIEVTKEVPFFPVKNYVPKISFLSYSESLPPLAPGDLIIIQGFIHETTNIFSIDLLNAFEDANFPDIPLHISPRFFDLTVARNSFIGEWGEEETISDVAFTLKRNSNFSFSILVGVESFSIQINGFQYCDYNYRLPLDKINQLDVRGGVTVKLIQIGHQEFNFLTKSSLKSPSVMNLTYSRNLLPLSPGVLIRVQGKVPKDANRFAIDLMAASKQQGLADIALHVNLRFPERIVIFNTNINGSWGPEEISTNIDFPAQDDSVYVISISIGLGTFSVQINGFQYPNYGFRLPLHDIYGLEVRGHALVYRVII